VTHAQFADERLADPALLALTGKVKIHRDAALSRRYPRGIPNRLTIALADGRQLVREVEFPRGHAENPMTDAEVEKKFRSMVEPRFGKAKADAILAACWDLEKLPKAGDLTKLVQG
jgi:2-methylcitrate dehydratase